MGGWEPKPRGFLRVNYAVVLCAWALAIPVTKVAYAQPPTAEREAEHYAGKRAQRALAMAEDAFDQAKRLVEQWEKEQNLTPPSNPQRFVGGHAAQMLRQAEQAAH